MFEQWFWTGVPCSLEHNSREIVLDTLKSADARLWSAIQEWVTIIESRSDETEGDHLGRFESQTSESESTDEGVRGLHQRLHLGVHWQGWVQMNTEDFYFVPDLHMTTANIQRGDGLQPGKTLPWAKDLVEYNWSPLSRNQNVNAETHCESAPFQTEPGSGFPCRVEYRPRIDETWFRGTSWSLRWGIRIHRRGQVRGRFPEERQNRSSRHRTWDPRWPRSTICQWDTIESKPTPARTLRNWTLVAATVCQCRSCRMRLSYSANYSPGYLPFYLTTYLSNYLEATWPWDY